MDALQSRFVLKRHPWETERARNLVAEACGDLAPEVALTAQLLVSELFTAALDHGTGLLTLTVSRTPDELRAEVTDHFDGPDGAREADAPEEPVRGLLILEALAHSWGMERRAHDGSTIWFTLTIPG